MALRPLHYLTRSIMTSASSSGVTRVATHNQYVSRGIEEGTLLPSPMAQFQQWFQQAQNDDRVEEPEAMTVSTVHLQKDEQGSVTSAAPSSRTVLLKQADPEGFVFYTNYSSRKGQEIATNPSVGLNFYWKAMHRQVRVIGTAKKVSKEESDEYFNSRPVGSRVGAWASPQSQVIPSRTSLANKVKSEEVRFGVPGASGIDPSYTPSEDDKQAWAKAKVDRPSFWGGYRIEPLEVEFWAGRPNRLHDRIRYVASIQRGNRYWLTPTLAMFEPTQMSQPVRPSGRSSDSGPKSLTVPDSIGRKTMERSICTACSHSDSDAHVRQ